MNWKHLAVDKLRQYSCMKASIQNLARELSVAADTDYRDALKQKLDSAQCWVETVEQGLAALSEEERYVLWEMYIDPKPRRLDRLSSHLHVEQAQIYRRRDIALKRFTCALYGTAEV